MILVVRPGDDDFLGRRHGWPEAHTARGKRNPFRIDQRFDDRLNQVQHPKELTHCQRRESGLDKERTQRHDASVTTEYPRLLGTHRAETDALHGLVSYAGLKRGWKSVVVGL